MQRPTLMENLDLFSVEHWQPFALFGLTHPFFNINKETVVYTWIILGILFVCCLPVRIFINKKYPVARHMLIQLVMWFSEMCTQALGAASFQHFSFITSLFLFIFITSVLTLVPGMEEPTKDLNTTLALGLISFGYIQICAIQKMGTWGYIKTEYLDPFFMLPLHLIGKIASIISISFRLFGNIFGGATITAIFFKATRSHWFSQTLFDGLGLNLPIHIFFGIFEGFLQAFVFAMLTLTYLSIALEHGAHSNESDA
ncbi:MAG TPA: FoF1 ATP synthase subunit a [Candidatus Babeliales bacterium]|nr:FoF1 ATP synthase subunit a [Candidatus Babeliales bacterium]